MRNVQVRYALYYPRIHFRDIEWLKATLLAFGRVYRVVPPEHPLDADPVEVRALSRSANASKPLIYEINPDWGGIENAQRQLASALDTVSPDVLRDRFGRMATARSESLVGPYEIHDGKVNGMMLERLRSLGIVWAADGTNARGPWLRLHPELGEAIMGVTAIAAARGKGCDVVTDSGDLHVALCALDEGVLLERLVAGPHAGGALPADRAVSYMAHAVFTANFDLSSVSLDDVAGLVRDGSDLRAFREHLASFADRLPEDLDPHERNVRVRELAEEVVVEWDRFNRSLPSRLRQAFAGGVGDAVAELAKEAVAGLTAATVAGGVGGIAAAFGAITAPVVVAAAVPASIPIAYTLVKAGATWWSDSGSGPHRYLGLVAKAGGLHLARSYPA